MKYIPFIQKNIKSLFKDNRISFISFIIGPLLIALIYGTMMEASFNASKEETAINVTFLYDEESYNGKIFKDVLDSENVKSFINSTDDGDIEVEINDDFNDINIKNIHSEAEVISIVKIFMEEVSSDFNKYKVIHDKAEVMNHEKILGEYFSKVQDSNRSVFNKKLVDGFKTLDSWEYYGISAFSFTSMLLLIIFINRFFNDKKEGVIRRTLSAAITKKEYITSFFICSSFEALIINLIYVTMVRILEISFSGNILGLLAAVIGQSLLQGGIVTLFISMFKSKKVINLVLTAFITLSSVLGGSFYNVDLIDLNILQILKNISPNTLILNAYKFLAVSNNVLDSFKYVFIMLIISVICLFISRIKVCYRWEEI